MPAQTEEGQIPVPIFRMLGSDPIYQYDDGLGQERQGVISLEPVYEKAGMDRPLGGLFLGIDREQALSGLQLCASGTGELFHVE